MRSKYLAGLSLAIMACGFLVTLWMPQTALVFLLRGAFEAGLVGGIADWFAVTALFRHPFGIPIPHTSLLLKNRDKIVRSLISAMENELLNKESIENKLRQLHLLRAVGSISVKLLRKRTVRTSIVDFLMTIVRRLPLEQSLPVLQSGISDYIRRVDAAAAAESALTKAMYARLDQKAFDYVITEALQWAARPETGSLLGRMALGKLSEARAKGLMGFAIQAFAGFMDENKLGSMIQNMLISAGEELLDQDNEYRERIMQEIRIQLFQIAGDENRLGQIKEWAVSRLNSEEGQAFLKVRLEEMRSMLLDKLALERSRGGRAVFSFYRNVVRSLSKESEWLETAENRLLDYVVNLVESNHYRIGQLVKENLDRMDDASLVRMLEEKIGKDLQWIRVNGAICGFVIGLVLSAIELLRH
ncbi:DUF445 domain-containing protein [Cohnella pontilimi]|uniref:DUF445 domain-containing protein n=1 Tax=Cohnella pontilimi TaxID=2564100 RepID=A0A4U0F7K6_9BACL|nr:DUF445 domain-containing protein [Cohnella pontilimi]TJY40697.1 DUF445 domain-containing protein [Cohnella pontilimi]